MAFFFFAPWIAVLAAPFVLLFRSRRRELLRAIASRKMTRAA